MLCNIDQLQFHFDAKQILIFLHRLLGIWALILQLLYCSIAQNKNLLILKVEKADLTCDVIKNSLRLC